MTDTAVVDAIFGAAAELPAQTFLDRARRLVSGGLTLSVAEREALVRDYQLCRTEDEETGQQFVARDCSAHGHVD